MKTLNGYLVDEINECYLFHGTKSNIIDAIEHKGFDTRISGESAMFGSGVYFAESSTKADQYVGKSYVCSDEVWNAWSLLVQKVCYHV